MIALYLLLFSMLFFTLIFGAIMIQVFKKHLVISARTMDYFHLSEDEFRREMNQGKIEPERFKLLKKMSASGKYLVEKLMPTSKRKQLEQRLREAGYPLHMSSVDFRFLQVLVGLIILIGMYTLLGNAGTSLVSSLFLASVFAILGMYIPSFYLSVLIKKRREEILKSMPDFFDMVNLSIEAGMGLDAALLKVSKQTKGALSEEIIQTLEDMKLGKSRREAFSDLRNRVPVPQFQVIITSLIQADLLGIGMAKVIRSLNERIREQRTQLAREQAMKAPVKMVFPMLLFIFPAIFIVLLGPLVIYLLETIF